jgi:hypothetical protein
MRSAEGQVSGAIRVTPRPDTILTCKVSRKRARATGIWHASDLLSVAGDVEWKGEVESSVRHHRLKQNN